MKALLLLVIIGESFGSLARAAGFITRFTAASLAVIMLEAITVVHLPPGFFMNWFGRQQGEGYHYPVSIMASAAAFLFMGAGPWSEHIA
jgi:putative oxidoreductase